MPSFSKEWEQEFDMMKQMQEDRMHMASGKQCLQRCTKQLDFLTNALLPYERSCLDECLAKRAQASFIVAANVSKFEEMEHRTSGKKKSFL
jgi:hypothetical protein